MLLGRASLITPSWHLCGDAPTAVHDNWRIRLKMKLPKSLIWCGAGNCVLLKRPFRGDGLFFWICFETRAFFFLGIAGPCMQNILRLESIPS